MMFKLYSDVKAFYGDVYDVLMKKEAQNMLILGNLIIGYEGKDTFGWRNTAEWAMAAVSCDEKIRLVALMTPPYGITMYACGDFDKELDCLIDGLISSRINVPAVIAEKSLAAAFAEKYCIKMGLGQEIAMSQRIYQLDTVNLNVPQIGRFREADERDLSFMPFWYEDFFASATNIDAKIGGDIEKYRHVVTSGKTFLLEDNGCAVSVAMISRQTASAACVSYVYTPPYFRGRGYASSVVAQLSQKCLDEGFKSCVLYTDLKNPTSNSIYKKIGYKPIADSLEIKFYEVKK